MISAFISEVELLKNVFKPYFFFCEPKTALKYKVYKMPSRYDQMLPRLRSNSLSVLSVTVHAVSFQLHGGDVTWTLSSGPLLDVLHSCDSTVKTADYY